VIRIENLSKAFGPKTLLSAASYHFPEQQRIALVGANGAGKTTLLNILSGEEESDGGKVLIPNKLSLGYLPQIPNPHPQATILEECVAGASKVLALQKIRDTALSTMTENYTDENHAKFEFSESEFTHAGGYLLESRAREILSGLGFQPKDFAKNPLLLSGGWRMRLELARVFLNHPDFLILDEPTNHLDLPSLAWVEKYLASFRGTVLFVSHDRDLLNRLPTIVLHLYKGQLNPYHGNFDKFLEEREQRAMQETALAEKLRQRRENLERFAERFGAKASKAKQAQSKLKMLSRIQELESELSLDTGEPTLAIQIPHPTPSGREVLLIENGAIGYKNPLATGINIRISRGQKIAIIGINGIGKSTLLKTVVNRIPALQGVFQMGHEVKHAYFAQEQLDVLNLGESALANTMGASSRLTEKQARSLLGSFLFRGDEVFKPVRVLSGGEKSRVGLARLLASEANFLILDEPTNHLDMSSVETLSQAIADFSGTVLFVSHDRTFINNVCTHVFVMLPDGRSALFAGKLEDYERLAALSNFPNVLEPTIDSELLEGSPSASPHDQASPLNEAARASDLKRERQKLEKTVTRLNSQLEGLSTSIAQLEDALLTHDALDYVKARDNHQKQEVLRKDLATTEHEWLEASERLETVLSDLRALGRL
jgi:ATP-binding cassette subfamily F protein 3